MEGVATIEAVLTGVGEIKGVGVGVAADDRKAEGVREKAREGELDTEEDTVALTVPPLPLTVSKALGVSKVDTLIN